MRRFAPSWVRPAALLLALLAALVLARAGTSSAAPDLVVTLDAPATAVAGGDPFTVTVNATNGTSELVTAYTVTVPLPAGLTFDSSPDGCTLESLDTVTCERSSLEAGGGAESFSFDLRADADALGPRDLSPGVTVDPDTVTVSTTDASVDVVGEADLGVSLVNDPDAGVVAGGAPFDAKATVSNGGPSDSHTYKVTYHLSSTDLSFATPYPSGCTLGTEDLTCVVSSSIPADGSAPVLAVPVNAAPHALLDYGVTATVATATDGVTDGESSNDADTQTVTVVDVADLQVTNDVTNIAGPGEPPPLVAGHVVAGEHVQYDVSVTNDGPSDARSVALQLALDTARLSDIQVCSVDSELGCGAFPDNFEPLTGSTLVSGVTLTPGASRSFVVRAKLASSAANGSWLNSSASATTSATDDGTPNADAANALVDARADLELVTLAATPFALPAGNPANTLYANNADPSKLNLTATIKNNGPSDAQAVSYTLALPTAELELVTAAGSGTLAAGATDTRLAVAKAKSTLRDGEILQVAVDGTATSTTDDPTPGNNTKTSTADQTIFTVPNPPEAILATAGNTEAGLQWRRPDNDGGKPITDYRIYACRTANPALCVTRNIPDENENATFNGEAIFSYVISGLTNGISYTLTVTAFNAVGESDRSNGLTVTPTQVADTEVITNNTATVNTGVGTGAVGCAQATNPDCRNIVSTYTINDPNNNGSLVNVNAEGRNSGSGSDQGFESLGGMALLAAVVAEPVFECIEVDLNSGVEERATENCGKGDKVIRSTYPLAEGDRLHLETDVYDRTITTDAAGVACLSLKTNPDGTLPRMSKAPRAVIVNCDFPEYPRLFTDSNGNKTNICPHGVGWKPLKPCAYVYFASVLMPGFDISGFRPVPCTTGANCNRTTLIGSSVAAGIRIHPLVGGLPSPAIKQIVRPWCTGIFPFFVWKPCVARYVTLPGLPSSPNLLDMRVDTFMNNDPLKTGSTG